MDAGAADNWEDHWDRYAQTNAVNPANDYRRRLIFDQLGHPEAVLDVGSGQGDLLCAIHDRFPQARLLGLELSAKGVEISRKKLPDARFLQRDLLQAMDPPQEFRAFASHAVCSEVLEHLESPEVLLRNVRPFLKDDAKLIITVPAGPRSAFDKHIGHRRHFRPELLADVLRQAGFRAEHIWRAGFPFFTLYRMMVVARGQKLIRDVDGPASRLPLSARAAMAAFDGLFRFNMADSRGGWQLLAVARPN